MLRRSLFLALLALAVAAIVAACAPPSSPGEGGAHVPIAPIVDVSCVLLRLVGNGRVDEVCATAEELAPYVPDLIAARDEDGDASASPIPGAPSIAFSVRDPCKSPRKPRVRRPKDAGVVLVVHPVESSKVSDAAPETFRDSPSE